MNILRNNGIRTGLQPFKKRDEKHFACSSSGQWDSTLKKGPSHFLMGPVTTRSNRIAKITIRVGVPSYTDRENELHDGRRYPVPRPSAFVRNHRLRALRNHCDCRCNACITETCTVNDESPEIDGQKK